MNLVFRLLLNALIIFALAWALPGIQVDSYWNAIWVAVVLGLLNVLLRPLLILLTIPITLITFGLFLFVINAFVVWLVGEMMDSFQVASFWWALLFSLLMTALNAAFYKSQKESSHPRGR